MRIDGAPNVIALVPGLICSHGCLVGRRSAVLRRSGTGHPPDRRAVRRVRAHGTDRPRAGAPRQERRSAHADDRRHGRRADPAGQQVRLHRRSAGRTRRRRPLPRRRPDRLGHRLSRRGHHHLPAWLGARADNGGRGVGVRGHRYGRRVRSASARRHRDGDALPCRRGLPAAGALAHIPVEWIGHHARQLRGRPGRDESPSAGV